MIIMREGDVIVMMITHLLFCGETRDNDDDIIIMKIIIIIIIMMMILKMITTTVIIVTGTTDGARGKKLSCGEICPYDRLSSGEILHMRNVKTI